MLSGAMRSSTGSTTGTRCRRSRREEYLGFRVGLHANIGETSAVMAVDETLIDLDAAVARVPEFPGGASAPLVSAFFLSGKGRHLPRDPVGRLGRPGRIDRGAGSHLPAADRGRLRGFMEGVTATFERYPERP